MHLQQGGIAAVRELGDGLRERQLEADIDPYESDPGEVKLGLAGRQWRLLRYVVTDLAMWAEHRTSFLLRPMVDTRIVAGWLLTKNEPELFTRFVEFGRGRLKLRKLHLEDVIDDDGSHFELSQYLDYLETLVNADVIEEMQSIDLGGNFAGVNIRDMAREAGAKRLYDLFYQPMSADVHGEWGSMLEADLVPSRDPLHRGHRFGRFTVADEAVVPEVVIHGFSLAAETIGPLFESLGVDVHPELRRCQAALSTVWKEAVVKATADER
jgi:hypothetical protein